MRPLMLEMDLKKSGHFSVCWKIGGIFFKNTFVL